MNRLRILFLTLTACLSAFGQAPSLFATYPNSAPQGAAPLVIWVAGSGFDATSIMHLDGVPLATSSVGGGALEGIAPASLLATARTAQVTVVNGGTQVSNPVPFDISPIATSERLMIHGPAIGSDFGRWISSAGDFDQDQIDDLLASTNVGGTAIFSGATGTQLASYTWSGLVASLGDLDLDGVPDFAVGTGAGVHVVSASTGTLIRTHATATPVLALDAGEDVNGDGFGDLVFATSASIDLHSGLTGALVTSWTGWGSSAQARFVGDRDGDGISEVALGDRFAGFGGSVGVYSVQSGALVTGWTGGFDAGRRLYRVGDIDGDGLVEIAFQDGSDVVLRYSGGSPNTYLEGDALVGLGDFNGDGKDELALGQWSGNDRISIFSGPTLNWITTLSCPGGNNDFGLHLPWGIDLTGDGEPDLVTGAPGGNGFGPQGSGFVWGARMPAVGVSSFGAPCHPYPNIWTGATLGIDAVPLGGAGALTLSSQLANVPGILAIANSLSPPLSLGTGCTSSVLLDPATAALLPFTTDGNGGLSIPFVFPNDPLLAGQSFHLQAILFQVPNTPGYSVTRGVTLHAGY